MHARTLEHVVRPRTAAPGLEVFGVEDTTAQLVWSDLGEGGVQVALSAAGRPDRRIELDTAAGPGAFVVEELAPGTSYDLRVRTPAGRTVRRRLTTLEPPRGEELFRFATVSDLHLGRGGAGYRVARAMARPEVQPAERASERANGERSSAAASSAPTGHEVRVVDGDPQFAAGESAIAESIAWGARHLVVKGDLCDETYDWIWDQAARLLGSLPVPVSILPGNHDTGELRHFEPEVGAARRGLHLTRGVEHLDVPGLRLVLMDSTRPGTGWGAIARHADEVAALAASAPSGVFVATHHHPQRLPVPVFWPHGIPSGDARRFTTALHEASPNVLVSSGHTHRCRRRVVDGVDWSEVAATSHFPGVWAGYAVHEGGIRQVVRRIADPGVMAWSESTRHHLGGAWALWSSGVLSDRCFTLDWR